MRCLVAVFLVLQVCYTGVIGADVQINQDCSASGSTCVPADTNVCDSKADTAHTCKTKVGKNCTTVGDCIKNAVCDAVNTPCHCSPAFTPSADSTTCVKLLGQQCSVAADCVAADATCTGSPTTLCGCPTGKSPNSAKTQCSADSPPAIAAGVVNGACKTGDTCDGALTCDKNADGGAKCKTKVGETCAAKGDCIKNADCTPGSKPCNCTAGYNVNTEKTVCESAGGGSTSLTASMLLLAALFVTSRFL